MFPRRVGVMWAIAAALLCVLACARVDNPLLDGLTDAGGDTGAPDNVEVMVELDLQIEPIKQFNFTWNAIEGAYYQRGAVG